ncbi:carbohydrate-binding family 9-like protein [bacterium]|nr:carbohydrate-binding family 9-like protein [bacterium]
MHVPENTTATRIWFSTALAVTMLLGAMIMAAPTSVSVQDVKSYTINRASGAITIDGKLDDAAWKNAPEATLTETNTGKPVPLRSTVKLLWDDTYLYVGYYCEDPDAWATIEKFDGALWDEEVVEIFIDPGGKGITYYELEVSPINNAVDLFVLNQGKAFQGRISGWFDWSFKDLKRAVYVDGDGKKEGTKDKFWTVELAIPFDEMWLAETRPPQDGDMWRINCYRIERGDSKKKDDDWYAAFNPTKRPSFHTPWEFGKFTFKK